MPYLWQRKKLHRSVARGRVSCTVAWSGSQWCRAQLALVPSELAGSSASRTGSLFGCGDSRRSTIWAATLVTAVSQDWSPCRKSCTALSRGLLAETACGSGSGCAEVNSFNMFRVFVGFEASRLSPHACPTFLRFVFLQSMCFPPRQVKATGLGKSRFASQKYSLNRAGPSLFRGWGRINLGQFVFTSVFLYVHNPKTKAAKPNRRRWANV